MSPTEQAMVDKLKTYLQTSERFQCAACSIARPRNEALGVFLWKPGSKMMARAAQNRIAPYVICTECGRKPERETRPLIEAMLAKKGLFG